MKSLTTLILLALFSYQGFATSAMVVFKKGIQVNETFALQIGNYLEWETSQEKNTNYFVVERSIDGKVFTQVGEKIQSEGSEFIGNSYSFLDVKAIKGNNFYRLKLVSSSGDVSYSTVYEQNRTLSNDIVLEKISDFEVEDLIKVEYTCTKDLEFEYTLLNAQGEVIENDWIIAEKDANEFVLSLKSFSAGQYFLKFENGDEIEEVVLQKI